MIFLKLFYSYNFNLATHSAKNNHETTYRYHLVHTRAQFRKSWMLKKVKIYSKTSWGKLQVQENWPLWRWFKFFCKFWFRARLRFFSETWYEKPPPLHTAILVYCKHRQIGFKIHLIFKILVYSFLKIKFTSKPFILNTFLSSFWKSLKFIFSGFLKVFIKRNNMKNNQNLLKIVISQFFWIQSMHIL